MDDGEVILIAPDTKNQDGSQTYFILDPCPAGDCVDDPPGIELIDLTDEYQVKNTGAIAVVSTNSTGALEITLKKPKEEMDVEDISEVKELSGDIGSSSDNIDIIDMITDDDTKRQVVLEDEDIDVEEINIHNISGNEIKSESESIVISEGGEEPQSQNDQDDDTEEDTLYIDDAKSTDLQEELAQETLQDLNRFDENVVRQIESREIVEETTNTSEIIPVTTSDGADDIEIIECIQNKNEAEVISLTFDVVSTPTYVHSVIQNEKAALVHGQLIEIPTDNPPATDSDEKELTESTNTALTLLELAGSTGTSRMEIECRETEGCLNSGLVTNTSIKESESARKESILATLHPVPLDPLISSPSIPENANATSAVTDEVVTDPPSTERMVAEPAPNNEKVVTDPTPKAKTDTTCTPRTPGVRLSQEELVKRLKDGDIPRQLLGKDASRGREPLYMSPLVTQAEIAQEFMERQLQKNPYTEPSSGDYIFAMKLTHRLATKIVPSETATSQLEEERNEKKEDDRSATANSQNSLHSSENESILKTTTDGEKGPKKSYAMSDKIELLKILEDDPDDVSSSEASQIILEQKVKSDRKKSQHAPLIKMHPELEKELALKQLQDFNQGVTRSKKRVSFIPDLKNNKIVKDHEHNNNLDAVKKQANGTKKRASELQGKPSKKVKSENMKAVTADPSQITETLTVEGQTLVDDPSIKDSKSIKQYSNKRLSRSSETPPRHLPMDLIMNGTDDLPKVEETSSKNKIFKATNPRKRKEELQEKRQKNFTNVFQRNKPQKRRGRPPKKKLYPSNDDLNKEFLLKASLESNKGVAENNQEHSNEGTIKDKGDKPVKTKKMREIERLLGDEGAINMLYSVEQKRASGGESKRGMLPSYRRKKKDLILKTKLVKSAVLRLTTNPPLSTARISLRGQPPKEGEGEESDKSSLRKMSVDSHDSHHSLSSPPPESFSFPAKIVPAEASRIIRRHSSSSNYSSRSNSPRRLSVDGERINVLSPEAKPTEEEPVESSLVSNSKQKALRTPQQTVVESVKKSHDKTEKLLIEKPKESTAKDPQPKSALDCKRLPSSAKSKTKLPIKIEPPRLRGRRRIFVNEESKNNTELNTSLAAAVEDFAKENKSGGKNIPLETPKKLTLSVVPSSKAVYRKSTDIVRTRTPKASKVYKEITLKRHDQVVEISITPVSSTLQNAFNTNVLHELSAVLPGLSKDDNCHVVLITSQGTVFCQGVDFPALVKPTVDQRNVAALEMGVAIKDFVKSIAMLARPVVVAVHGPAVGLGVTLLPLCDVVLAAEHATFHTPYTRLGQVPEGAATLTFPSLLGNSVTSELLFGCRKFSATEAQQAGLVTRVLPGENFRDEVLAVAKTMSSHSPQAMNATKVLLRHGMLTGLETTLVSEIHLLTKHWPSAECQANFASVVDKGDFILASSSTPTPTTTSTAATTVTSTSAQSNATVDQ